MIFFILVHSSIKYKTNLLFTHIYVLSNFGCSSSSFWFTWYLDSLSVWFLLEINNRIHIFWCRQSNWCDHVSIRATCFVHGIKMLREFL